MFCVSIAAANAQSSNGTVIGAITDTTGRTIVGATVTIVSADTDAVRSTVTNEEGTYRIESVLPGIYDVSAAASGFQTTINKGLVVPGMAIVSSSIVLKVGQAADRVEVSADNAVLNTDNGQIDGTIWNENGKILAEPAELSSASIKWIHKIISEHFILFNLNITTDPSVYQRAPARQRMRVIFTPEGSWFGAGTGASR